MSRDIYEKGMKTRRKALGEQHPGVQPILWDYTSAYYSWGILASAGAYVFQKQGTDYDTAKTGVNSPGAVNC